MRNCLEELTLQELKLLVDVKHNEFICIIQSQFPGKSEWDWFRALKSYEDSDPALAASLEIRNAYDYYIKVLQTFYAKRDGLNGFLGKYSPVKKL